MDTRARTGQLRAQTGIAAGVPKLGRNARFPLFLKVSRWISQSLDPNWLKLSGWLLAATLCVRVIALGKESLLAGAFGLTGNLDAFVAALFVPTLVGGQIANAVNASLTPKLCSLWEAENYSAANIFATSAIGAACGLAGIVSCALWIWSPLWAALLLPGAPASTIELTSQLIQILTPFGVLAAAGSILATIIAVRRRPLFSVLAPGFVPLAVGIAAIVGSHHFGVASIAYGSDIGAAAWVLSLAVLLRSEGVRAKFGTMHGLGARSLSSEFGLALSSSFLTAILSLVDILVLASGPVGAIAALNIANKISAVVIYCGHSLSAYLIYPAMCAMSAKHQATDLVMLIYKATAGFLLIGVLSWIAALFGGRPLLAALIQHGRFGAQNTQFVSHIFVASAAFIGPDLAVIFLFKAAAATGRNGAAAASAAGGIGLKILLNRPMADHFGVAGVVWASSIDYILQMVLLLVILSTVLRRPRFSQRAAAGFSNSSLKFEREAFYND